jgi:hypothetical protein
LRKQPDHLAIEGRHIVGATTGHNAVINDNVLIYPLGAGVFEICLERWPQRHLASANAFRLDQHPKAMADACNRLGCFKEAFDEWLCVKGLAEAVRLAVLAKLA